MDTSALIADSNNINPLSNNSKKAKSTIFASIGSSSKAVPIARNLNVSVFPIPTNLEHQLTPSEEEEALDTLGPLPSLSDPFLLVHLRRSRPPPRPKGVYYLFLLAFVDFCLITLCTVLLAHDGSWDNDGQWHWRRAEWDMVGLGILRVFTVVGVVSSIWLRELGWILGGVCGISSLYIIFKTNVIFQHRRKTQSYHLALLATSFLFCIIHLISYIVVTADTKRRDALLKSEAIEFTEETNIRDNSTSVDRDADMGASIGGGSSSSDTDALLISGNGHQSQTDKNYGTLNGHVSPNL